jgi:hypothetical protein
MKVKGQRVVNARTYAVIGLPIEPPRSGMIPRSIHYKNFMIDSAQSQLNIRD